MEHQDSSLKKAEFNSLINEKFALIAFSTCWSSPCTAQQQILGIFERQEEQPVLVGYIDVDRYPELAARYRIQTVPTLIFFSKSREIKRQLGLQSLAAIQESWRLQKTL